jgi:hypothetical protein
VGLEMTKSVHETGHISKFDPQRWKHSIQRSDSERGVSKSRSETEKVSMFDPKRKHD